MDTDIRKDNYFLKSNGSIYKPNKVKLANFVASIFTAILLIVSGLVIVANKAYDYAIVEGLSMYPTINSTVNSKDIAYFSYSKKASKGDVIIVNYKAIGEGIQAIKRLIATGGDTICYYGGKILLNGKALNETYLEKDYEYLKSNSDALNQTGYLSADEWKEQSYEKAKAKFEHWCGILINEILTEQQKDNELPDTEFFKNYSTKYAGCVTYSEVLQTYVLKVPDNFIFFLGDNRTNSHDCNSFGPIESKYLDAKVIFITPENFSVMGTLTKKILYLFS